MAVAIDLDHVVRRQLLALQDQFLDLRREDVLPRMISMSSGGR